MIIGKLDFIHLFEVEEDEIITLMNNKMVRKYLPLLVGSFSTDDCKAFLDSKKKLWDKDGFGPWAFLINDEFAGWGGLQL